MRADANMRRCVNVKSHHRRRIALPIGTKMCSLATKIATRPNLGEVAGGDGFFSLGKERFNSFVRYNVNLLVGCACLHGVVTNCSYRQVAPSRIACFSARKA